MDARLSGKDGHKSGLDTLGYGWDMVSVFSFLMPGWNLCCYSLLLVSLKHYSAEVRTQLHPLPLHCHK